MGHRLGWDGPGGPSEGETREEQGAGASRQRDSNCKGSEEVWRDRKKATEAGGGNRREWEGGAGTQEPRFYSGFKKLAGKWTSEGRGS